LLVLGNEHGPSSPPSPINNNNNNKSTNWIEMVTTAAGQDYQCQVCQEFGYQIYATLGSFYIPLAVMAAVYYQIFQAAKRIVDEEKKAQSHLLMTRTNSCAKQKAAATSNSNQHKPAVQQSSLLVHSQHHQPSLCNSAAMVVVRRHSDRRNSSMDSTDHSWVAGHCNGGGRPTTWPPNNDVCISSSSDSSCASLMATMKNEAKFLRHEKEKEKIQTSGGHPLSQLEHTNNMLLLDIPLSNNCPRHRHSSSGASTAEIHVYDDEDHEELNRRSHYGNPPGGSAEGGDDPSSTAIQSTQAALNPPSLNVISPPAAVPGAAHGNHQQTTAGPLPGIRVPPHPENQLHRRGSRNRLRFALNKERKVKKKNAEMISLIQNPFIIIETSSPALGVFHIRRQVIALTFD
jgi:hypothetical protein